MIHTDLIYGNITFQDPIIDQIIASRLFQRLKGLSQNGLYGLQVVIHLPMAHGQAPTRYQHSIGVAYLCQRFGASIEVQIYGLLHDLYHTNFSHDIDYLKDGTGQVSFHEANKQKFFEKISGLDQLSQILGSKYLPVLEDLITNQNQSTYQVVKSKELGADGLDYFMRDGFTHSVIVPEWIDNLLSNAIILKDNHLLFTSTTEAQRLQQELFEFTKVIDQTIYNGATNKGYNFLSERLLRLVLAKGIITEDQLFYGYESDLEIWKRITSLGDPEIECLCQLLRRTEFFYGSEPFLPKGSYIVKANVVLRHRSLGHKELGESKSHSLFLFGKLNVLNEHSHM